MDRQDVQILVVDDDRHLLELLVDTLTTVGYQATGVAGGVEALAALADRKFDLMISDIKMPEMDGIALLKRVRRHYPDLPVLFITGVTSPEIIGRASPDGFLAKPFRINHIEELIESTLKGKGESVVNQIRKVLVVDDDSTFREMLAETLRYNEFVPCTATNGEEALRELDRGEIDAVVADIKMPGIDGISLMKTIKEKRPDLPVILVTAYLDDVDLKKENVDQMASGFLRKPFKVENIIKLLHEISPGPRRK